MTQRRTMQETRTTLTPAEVLAAAKEFFARRNTIYAAFPEQESAAHVSLRGQGGEELIVGVLTRDGATLVTASSYIFDAQISRFFATLPPVVGVPA
ncbi:MAG: hypothetical protein IPF98_24120 [Gemmatimonadetes bacterium]|nr:hypothetical protein [Gemmatimonadota bacterium]MCC6773050.1 hypothetical protein [Gemmatimonadaceae bacterium]